MKRRYWNCKYFKKICLLTKKECIISESPCPNWEKTITNKKCSVCGEGFWGVSLTKYCPDCQKKAYRKKCCLTEAIRKYGRGVRVRDRNENCSKSIKDRERYFVLCRKTTIRKILGTKCLICHKSRLIFQPLTLCQPLILIKSSSFIRFISLPLAFLKS